jgi:sugar O-acyltransferase (sialic acid O-acetyltransferase NeuD family)
MKKDLILIGGGGHCKSCIDVIEKQGEFRIIGIVDKKEKNETIFGYKIIGIDDDLPSLVKTVKNFIITIGHIKTASTRKRIFIKLKELKAELPHIISPLAYVSRHASIGEGSIILHHALINAGASIGCNCIINSKALIEHDAKVGDHCHISTSAVVNGEAIIEAGCFLGSNATIRETKKICKETIIGAGAVIVKNIVESGVYFGNPAKRMRFE